MVMSDENLLKQAKQGDDNAFKELCLRYDRLVYSIAYNILEHREETLDIRQEAFLRLWRSESEITNVKAYLAQTTYRLSLNKIRDLKKRKAVSLDQALLDEEAEKTLGAVISNEVTDPSESALRKEKEELVQKEIKELPFKYQLIIILFYENGFGDKEIAPIVKLSLSAIKTSRYRIIKKIRDRLKGYGKNES